jgi:prepilin-type N-terminal cleavage/methylation domain-containing protein
MIFRGGPEDSGDEKGFTLIELIVVTALIGIMLSISIPSLRNSLYTDPLKATTRKVIGLVTGVRELSVRTQQPYLLHISRLENRIWYEPEIKEKEKDKLDSDIEKKGDLEGELLFPESVKISGIVVAKDVMASEDQTVIWIGKQGYMNDTLLRLEDAEGNHLNVQFYPFLEPELVSDQVAAF